jgi:hypothetical protein
MSTLQLSPEHLSAIAYGLQKHQVVSKYLLQNELNSIMIELLQHNCEEYSDRYPNDPADTIDLSEFYEYKQPREAEAITPIQFFKLAQCYQYNSSESPQWEGSKAQTWTNALMANAIASLPEYAEAKWHI